MLSKTHYIVIGTILMIIMLVIGAMVTFNNAIAITNDNIVPVSNLTNNISKSAEETAPILDTSEEVTTNILQEITNISSTETESGIAVDNVETDLAVIIDQVTQLVELYETETLDQSGWLYQRYQSETPPEFLSNTGEIYMIPVSEIRPQAMMLKEEWSLIEAGGQLVQRVGYTTDKDGQIRNKWAFTDGRVVLLLFINNPSYEIRELDRSQSISYRDSLLWLLPLVQEDPRSSGQAWVEDGTYHIILNIVNEEPYISANINNAIIIGTQQKYEISLTTGALEYSEISYQLEDRSYIFFESTAYLEQKFVDELPTTAIHLLDDATKAVSEMK